MLKKALASRWAGTTGTTWAVTIAVDLVAAQLVMSWWFPDTPGWIWSALFLGVIFLLNYISVRGLGEAEYWFSLIKVTTVIVFIIVGVLMIIGILQSARSLRAGETGQSAKRRLLVVLRR